MKIIQVPFSEGSMNKNKGTELAPSVLCKGLKSTIVKISKDIDQTYKNIELTNGDLYIGGDHSITYSTFKSFSKKYKNPALIILDAHPDAEVYTQTHTHEDFVRKLVDEKYLKKQNLIYIGLRNISKNEKQFLKQVTWFKSETKLEKIKEAIIKLSNKCDAIYLSVDTDVIDSKYYKSTGYPEKQGLTPTKFFKILNLIKNLNIKKIDLIKYNPLLDKKKKDLELVKKILKELLSLMTY